MPPEAPQWNNRIVGYADVDPALLLAHKYNFRNHPKSQQNAFLDAVDTLGFLQNVLVSKRSNLILDGHMRVSLALKQGQATIPVTYVDLDDDEERLALSTFDPISSLAKIDNKRLDALIDSLKSDMPDIKIEQNLFDDISPIDTAPLVELASMNEEPAQKSESTVETVVCPKCNHSWSV